MLRAAEGLSPCSLEPTYQKTLHRVKTCHFFGQPCVQYEQAQQVFFNKMPELRSRSDTAHERDWPPQLLSLARALSAASQQESSARGCSGRICYTKRFPHDAATSQRPQCRRSPAPGHRSAACPMLAGRDASRLLRKVEMPKRLDSGSNESRSQTSADRFEGASAPCAAENTHERSLTSSPTDPSKTPRAIGQPPFDNRSGRVP